MDFEKLIPIIDQTREEVIGYRRQIHENPELSFEEVETSTLVKERLEAWGIPWKSLAKPGLVGEIQGGLPGPTLALRADMDALPIQEETDLPFASKNPGVMHACGHDAHTANLLGVAKVLNQIKDQLPGRVKLIFQPAEEVGEGAKACLDIFAECKIDSFYAYHNYPGQPFQTVALNKGTLALTSKGLNLYFKGKPSHAMRPEDGINPSYAMAKLVSALENIQTDHSLFKGMIRLTIVHVAVGEKAFGISAGQGVLRLTIRALYDEDLQHLEDLVVAQAQSLSKQYQLEFSWDSQEYFPATVNHSEAVDKIWQVCQGQGQAIKELEEPFRASEDFAYFLQKVPGAMFFMGDGEDYAPLHTEGFDFPDGLIEPVVEVFYGLIQA